MKPLDILKKGDFNDMIQEWQPDGTVTITLFKRETGKQTKFRVKNLYKSGEKELKENSGSLVSRIRKKFSSGE